MSTPEETWKDLQSSTTKALKKTFPIEGQGRKLVLNEVIIDEKPAKEGDIRGQEKAKASSRTWGANVRGDISLVDKKTGKIIDRSKVKLLTLPRPTDRYSYIVNGSEWQVDNLWRLRPGVYSQVKANGDLETEFNISKPFAKEPRLKVPFAPQTKKFKLRWANSNIPLYSVLKMMGVQDEEMKKAWGKEIYDANFTKNQEKNIEQFYNRVSKRGVKAKSDSYDDMASALVKEFGNAELNPETTKKTLGKPYTSVTGDALLEASKRILAVARGDKKPDDRDSLVFKRLSGLDDYIGERLTKPLTQRTIKSKVGNNIDRRDKVRDIVSSELFGKPVQQVFTSSSLSKTPDQINPLEMLSNYRATTILGGEEGGIKRERTLSRSMKLINPSHMGFLDPIHTPESKRTGINLNLPMGVTKDKNEAKVLVYDLKEERFRSGKNGITPTELHSEMVVLPDQVSWTSDRKPKAIGKLVKMKDPETGEIVSKPISKARYLFASPHQLFDESTNLIPFLQNDQGNRSSMASRYSNQAIGLVNREEPLVQVKGGSSTWEKLIGKPFSQVSPVPGKVTKIRTNKEDGYAESILVKGKDGETHEVQLYNHFPLNEAKSFIHSTPQVKVGDEVKKDQVLADTNFTKDGTLALGTNLKVSYMPYKGYNFEDGIVISDSAAKKLTSEHVYRKSVDIDPDKDFMDKAKFRAYASVTAKQMSEDQLNKLDEDGVIRVGENVDMGDLLIAAVGKRENMGVVSRMASRLDRKLFEYNDKSVKWEVENPGKVVKVQKFPNGKGAQIHIRTEQPAEVGDKIVGRHANKAIITKILPDRDMPKIGGPDGEHTEILMNPSGVPSRINLGQMLETAASKIAKKTGEPYLVNNFAGPDMDYTEMVKRDLINNGLKDTEALYDPSNGRKLGDVLTGDQYIMKLKHQVEKKLSTRSGMPSGLNYTIDGAPKGSGSAHPGMAVGQLELYSLLAHGARANLKEMATYKSDRQVDDNLNPQAHTDFWMRVQTGQPVPAPKPSFTYKKFMALTQGLGIDTKKEGNTMQLVPLTDKGTIALSNGEIKDPGRALRGKDAKELEKGLFDPEITGGLPDPNDIGKGLKWSHIELAEPMPNPVFVGTQNRPGPAVVLSGLPFAKFEDVVKGKTSIEGKTGGEAIKYLLDKVDVNAELEKTKAALPNLRASKLNSENRKAKYLRALKELDMSPSEAYVISKVPVLPPVFRPIVPMPDGSLRFDDINYLYKNMGIVNNQLRTGISELPGSEQPLREELYDILKSTMGVGGKPQYESNRELKGILDTVAGPTPKQGFFQKKLMKRRQELSMRSTIIPEPSMHLDSVGIPRTPAMELYKPFVLRELHQSGRSPMEARKDVKMETPAAWAALEKALDDRPILLKRDPALHKFNFMAFKPKLVDGKAIRIHPLVTTGFNADFDGDTMSAFVPLTEEAVHESRKMFPSNNLFSSTTGEIMYSPSQEALLGINLLSRWGNKSDKKFNTYVEAKRAYDKGTLGAQDVITMNGKETTVGRLMIAKVLPKKYQADQELLHNPNFVLNKFTDKGNSDRQGVHNLLTSIAKDDKSNFATTVDKLKDLGNNYSYESGYSIGLKDLGPMKELREEILAKADVKAKKINSKRSMSQDDKDEELVKIYTKATDELDTRMKKAFAVTDNDIFKMIDSGARGKWSQFRQMNVAPMLMQGPGKVSPNPVRKSYSEGLDVGDYWTALHGARIGTLQRAEGTSEPGVLTKEIINTTIPELISSKNCGTSDGISMKISEDDVEGRFLAKNIKAGGRDWKEGELVTPNLLSHLKKNRVDKVVVRSPLKCSHGSGICAKCYGLNEDGNEHEIGTNIGVIAGHALGEPAMQLAMDSFHTGGVAGTKGAGSTSRMGRLRQLLNPPRKLPGSATLSKASGPVQKIDKDKATKGWNIYVGGEKHYVSSQHTLLKGSQPLKEGDRVKKGDPLSNGPLNPRELLPLTDVPTVQNYLTNELYDGLYKDERVRRRNIETVVRSLTNLTRVKDPGDSSYLGGDIALRTIIEEENKKLPPGVNPITHTPVIKGIAQGALDQQEDWMARLNFRKVKDSMMEGAAKGWKTDFHGSNPIPAYAYGAEFGDDKDPSKY